MFMQSAKILLMPFWEASSRPLPISKNSQVLKFYLSTIEREANLHIQMEIAVGRAHEKCGFSSDRFQYSLVRKHGMKHLTQ